MLLPPYTYVSSYLPTCLKVEFVAESITRLLNDCAIVPHVKPIVAAIRTF